MKIVLVQSLKSLPFILTPLTCFNHRYFQLFVHQISMNLSQSVVQSQYWTLELSSFLSINFCQTRLHSWLMVYCYNSLSVEERCLGFLHHCLSDLLKEFWCLLRPRSYFQLFQYQTLLSCVTDYHIDQRYCKLNSLLGWETILPRPAPLSHQLLYLHEWARFDMICFLVWNRLGGLYALMWLCHNDCVLVALPKNCLSLSLTVI